MRLLARLEEQRVTGQRAASASVSSRSISASTDEAPITRDGH
jgi:hypothetical protein